MQDFCPTSLILWKELSRYSFVETGTRQQVVDIVCNIERCEGAMQPQTRDRMRIVESFVVGMDAALYERVKHQGDIGL